MTPWILSLELVSGRSVESLGTTDKRSPDTLESEDVGHSIGSEEDQNKKSAHGKHRVRGMSEGNRDGNTRFRGR